MGPRADIYEFSYPFLPRNRGSATGNSAKTGKFQFDGRFFSLTLRFTLLTLSKTRYTITEFKARNIQKINSHFVESGVKMNIPLFLAGLILILIVLGDAFETMVLPRRVTRRVRLARLFFQYVWKFWLTVARLINSRRGMETFLGFFGPLSVLFLIILWATGLVFGFALMLWASGSTLTVHEGLSVSEHTSILVEQAYSLSVWVMLLRPIL